MKYMKFENEKQNEKDDLHFEFRLSVYLMRKASHIARDTAGCDTYIRTPIRTCTYIHTYIHTHVHAHVDDKSHRLCILWLTRQSVLFTKPTQS